MKRSGRTYDAQRAGLDERTGVVDVWIGRYLFKVPQDYVNVIGTGATHGTPGLSAILVATLPDMKIARKPFSELINGVDPSVQIWIKCDPVTDSARIKHTAARTRDEYLNSALGPPSKVSFAKLPELGLIAYKAASGSTTLFFPLDPAVKNRHGGEVAMECPEPYPPTRAAPRPLCFSTFALRDGVTVDYRFPEHFLKYWRSGHESLVRLLNSFLVEQ